MPNIFARLTKVDEEKRQVVGRATQEVVDKSNEIFDYATSAPYFKAWSEEWSKDTGGKSLGNIRAMHGKLSAGKITDITFNDAEKCIDITTKITDDNEWNKVLEGNYRGFSIGGTYVKKWPDAATKATRFTADPVEISIVDTPCVSTAKFFDVVKSDGAIVTQEFKKSLYDVSSFFSTLSSINWLAEDLQAESDWEGDNSPIPTELKGWFAEGLKIWLKLANEEVAEVVAGTEAPDDTEKSVTPAATAAPIVKEVTPMAEDLIKTEVAPETVTPPETLVKMADLEKIVTEQTAKLEKMADLEKIITEQTAKLSELAALVKTYSEKPQASPAELAALAKEVAKSNTLVEDNETKFNKSIKSALSNAGLI